MSESLFSCPICRLSLEKRETALICGGGHSFDLAKEGYAHLLPSDKMRAKIPGDSKEMVAARRAFLDSGGYAIFAEALQKIMLTLLPNGGVMLDAGCGEGYYTRAVANAFSQNKKPLKTAAFDISKFAVKSAAKRGGNGIEYAVAGSFDIPVADGCADAVLNIFSPMAQAEFARVLKKGGVLVFAVPSPRHLFGLKQKLYEKPYLNETREAQYDGFILEDRIPARGEITVQNAQIKKLFSMTPYYWKTPQPAAEALYSLDSLTTEIGFDFVVYRRG